MQWKRFWIKHIPFLKMNRYRGQIWLCHYVYIIILGNIISHCRFIIINHHRLQKATISLGLFLQLCGCRVEKVGQFFYGTKTLKVLVVKKNHVLCK